VNDPNNDDQPGAGGNAGWDRFTPRMEAAISQNYEIDRSFSQVQDMFIPVFMRRYWFVYKPKTIESQGNAENDISLDQFHDQDND
jgi:hypothetical protein